MAILLIDVHHDVFGDKVHGVAPRWAKLFEGMSAGYHGAIIKASDGIWPHTWFRNEWNKLKDAGNAGNGKHYGIDWFRGAYHFMRFDTLGGTPEQQADCFCVNVERAGGWGDGDIYPVIDVERGGIGSRNYKAGASEVVEKVTRYTERVKARTGRPILLYGRGIMYDLGIKSHMGCAVNWNPSYTDHPRQHGLESWSRGEKLLWQYTNGQVNKTSFPTECPGFGYTDGSVFLGTSDDKGKDLDDFRRHLINGESALGIVSDVKNEIGAGTVIVAGVGIGVLAATTGVILP